MKLLLSLQLILGLFLFGDCINLSPNNLTRAGQDVPPYTKWGQIAMKRTKERYPQADIIDYLHIGREKGTEHSLEKFKLWLKNNNKEFGVFVDIKFSNENEQIIDVRFHETTR